MKAAVRMACRFLALALLAAPTAQAAWAGAAPVTPFPGTSVSGTSVSGAAVEGRQETLPERVPEVSPEAARGDGAETQGVAAAGADAGPSDAAAPDGSTAAGEPAVPAGGSRLLRALAEAAAPHRAALEGPAPGTPGAAPHYVAEACPRGLLRRLLAGAADDSGALAALGVEREILTLCRERQEAVAGLFETEARLQELRAASQVPVTEPPAPAATAVQTPDDAPAVRESAPDRRGQASPLRAALAATGEKANEADPPAGDPPAGEPRAESRPAEPQGPRYAWFSIIGTAGALRAGVTDGTGVWFVREGDALPGGAAVAAIAGRPPAVRIRDAGEAGEEVLLPYRVRPGDGP